MIIKTQALIDISMVINCNNMSETKHLIALTFATWAAKQTRCVRNVYLVTLHMSTCGREGVRTGLMERLNLALAPYEGPEAGLDGPSRRLDSSLREEGRCPDPTTASG